jgi:Skp family chaperone for outer membrane proteins
MERGGMMPFRLFAAALLCVTSAGASAQTFGPPITGFCLLSRSGAIAASLAGQSMQAQLRQMQASLSAGLAQQQAAVDQQRRGLEARRSETAPIEYQRQLNALDQQAKAIEQQQNTRFIAAQTQAQQQIDQALNHALGRVVTANACSVIMERDHSYGWHNAMDITPAVTREMDSVLRAVAVQ